VTESSAGALGPEDRELLERVRQGDGDALEALLTRYEGQLFRFSMRMCRNREDAREVLQESLLAAARSMDGFRGDAALSTWLFTIARRQCAKRRRKLEASRPSGKADASTELEDERPAPDDAVADRQLLAAVEGAIAHLEPGYREVLLLRDVEGLTAPEVATALEMSVPQVKSRLHRARVALRQQLAPLFEERHPPRPGPAPTCPDISETFSRYLEDEISPDLCARMQDHVAGCEHCASTCDSLKHTLAVCHAVPAPRVPEHIQRAVRDEIRKLTRAS
jgi:RNA polymerase sigma-70 factor (ECF subfamily)